MLVIFFLVFGPFLKYPLIMKHLLMIIDDKN